MLIASAVAVSACRSEKGSNGEKAGGTSAAGGSTGAGGVSTMSAGRSAVSAGGSGGEGIGGAGGVGGASRSGGGSGPSAGGTLPAGGSHGGAANGVGGSLVNAAGRNGASGGGPAGGRAGSSHGNGGNGGSGGGFGSGMMKIMPIGDSTTQSTCWRAVLWQTLTTNHAGHFDFVGTHKSDIGCSPSNYDQDNEAYGSSLLSEAVSGTFANNRMCSPAAASGPCPKLSDFDAAFNTYQPDVALIHYGTNDVWNSVPTAQIMTGFDDLVDGLRAANANVKVFVAKIIPMNVTSATCSGCTCSACSANIAALSAALDTWAPMKSTAASPVAIVDQNTGFDATTDTRDGVHPNDSGSAKMAAKWDAALEPLF